ncbi:MAG: hypothetical protein HYW51_01660 [Candidatus Doudnabacteria bacterium]|nr:hypothetical protein [Candidatus Doudnabacteria bacterium]
MTKHLSAISLSLLLLFALSGSTGSISLLAVFVLGLILITYLVNFFRLGFTWPHLLLPTFFLLAVGFVFTIITTPTLRLIFLLVAAALFYFLETKLGRESHYLQGLYLFSIFGIYAGLFALRFYLNLNVWLLLLLIILATYFFSIQGFAGFDLSSKRNFIFIIVLVIAQSGLGLTLWPTHFLINAAVLFTFFYLLWIFAVSAFLGKLTMKKIFWQIGLVSVFLLIILSSAAWRPLLS